MLSELVEGPLAAYCKVDCGFLSNSHSVLPLTFRDEAAAKGELLLTTVSAKYFMKVIEHNPYKFAITL